MDPSSQFSEYQTILQTVVPHRYLTFTIQNPFPRPFPPGLNTSSLRVSVIDSPSAAYISPEIVCAIIVPPNRDSDWIFTTEAGLFQLILSSGNVSRLILISADSPNFYRPISFKCISNSLLIYSSQRFESLLLALSPKSLRSPDSAVPVIPFLSFSETVKCGSVLQICFGLNVGEMVIEDVELMDSNGKEFRRRLRFKRMPNYIQSQVRILPENGSDLDDEIENIKFELDNNGLLVQSYLKPMVAGLSVISSYLDSQIQGGIKPRTLCFGVGGGALVTFLSTELGFQVEGVEEDAIVLIIGKMYFGLLYSKFVHCSVGDVIILMKRLAYKRKAGCSNNAGIGSVNDRLGGKFDAIMVDLDSRNPTLRACAPPLEFIQKDVFLGVREKICDFGVLILNVISPNKSFYESLVSECLEVFKELYEIDVGNGENLVFIASVSEIQIASGNQDDNFLKKLKSFVGESIILSMKKIQRTASH